MTPAEQESLLLRQVAALRRRGHAHDQALRLARAGIGPGPLLNRVDAALAELAAGVGPAVAGQEPAAAGREGPAPLDLLAIGTAPPEALALAAAAIDARLHAAAALATFRLYLALLLAGPLVLASAIGWMLWFVPAMDWSAELGNAPLERSADFARFAGLPLAAGVILGVRRATERIAPGARWFRRAAALLQIAAEGGDPVPAVDDPVEQRYLETRRESVGSRVAAAELAEELVRDGERRLALFRHAAPVLGALVVGGLAWPIPLWVVLAPWRLIYSGGS